MILKAKEIKGFAQHLVRQEKSAATQEKYLRDVQTFCLFANGKEITKELTVAWKSSCQKTVIRFGPSILCLPV